MSNANCSTTISTNTTSTGSNITARASPGGSQACAACKYQRRRCGSDCPLAPHFPPNQQKHFLNAHKLFGVCNIMRVLKMVHPSQQEIAMKLMIVHANIRANDPVGGCYRIIRELYRQIDLSKTEYELVNQQLAIYRAEAENASDMENPSAMITNGSENCGLDVETSCVYDTMHLQAVDYNRRFQNQDSMCMDHSCYNNMGIKVDTNTSSMVLNANKQFLVNESEDIKPFLGIFDEKHTIVMDSKQSVASKFWIQNNQLSQRDKILMKEDVDTVQQMRRDYLKGVACLFSLTNSKIHLAQGDEILNE